MFDPLSNRVTEKCLRKILTKENYSLSPELENGETGTDIIAKKGSDILHIEVIGYKKKGPSRAKDFYEAFFRTVSRLNEPDCKHCIIALPSRAKIGLPARATHHKIAWKRISKAFPELEIWLVDYSTKTYNRTFWGDWLK
ncbi:MAG: hypothetical protein K8S14_07360 [Actinomycetia bacterium]|nr:hypothetical protein [Actinomycetes bacterium]